MFTKSLHLGFNFQKSSSLWGAHIPPQTPPCVAQARRATLFVASSHIFTLPPLTKYPGAAPEWKDRGWEGKGGKEFTTKRERGRKRIFEYLWHSFGLSWILSIFHVGVCTGQIERNLFSRNWKKCISFSVRGNTPQSPCKRKWARAAFQPLGKFLLWQK